jgi:hypothetical protein
VGAEQQRGFAARESPATRTWRGSTPGWARNRSSALVKYSKGMSCRVWGSDGWPSDTSPAELAWNWADDDQVVPSESTGASGQPAGGDHQSDQHLDLLPLLGRVLGGIRRIYGRSRGRTTSSTTDTT